ncbi:MULTISPECIES: hypothetical protein [unclassified Methanoregula]|uniref:hypothetical protein n=1 Tax=unclassified Methanoregula TaxID=2649730 RepID=UPI0009C7AA97|nr:MULTISPECIES: hypothetical protein [unclassified Methanoregula]OPX62881.1 MAG: hypothetical protein A4E33_02010 [Methanoregula sp. PtaB.Bin085]OPY35318.1 MAG: hypothetical protein A4E34_00846 [Methanoregula sp. PtaU1.Bin006]
MNHLPDRMPGETGLQYLGRVPLYYPEMTLPCAWDDGIFRLVAGLPGLSVNEHHEFIAGLDTNIAGTLAVFAGRMAMLSVRKNNPALLVAGLAARGLALIPADMEGQRMALCELTQLHHSAKKLGIDPVSLFHEAVGLAGKESAGILAFLDREPRNRSIECMGYYEVEGPSGLIYWSGDCPVAEGLLYDRPLIPDELREFWAAHDISLFYRGLFETAKPVLAGLSRAEHGTDTNLLAGSTESSVWHTFTDPSGTGWNTITFRGLMTGSDVPGGRWMTIDVNGNQVFGATASDTPPGNGVPFEITRSFAQSPTATVKIANGQNPAWGPRFAMHYYSVTLSRQSTTAALKMQAPAFVIPDGKGLLVNGTLR